MSLRSFEGDVEAAIASIYVAPTEGLEYRGPKRYLRPKKSRIENQGKAYHLGARRSDGALTQWVTDPLTSQLIGYVFQPDGKGAGYCWRLPWQRNMSKEKFRTAREAVANMMAFDASPQQAERRVKRQDRINA